MESVKPHFIKYLNVPQKFCIIFAYICYMYAHTQQIKPYRLLISDFVLELRVRDIEEDRERVKGSTQLIIYCESVIYIIYNV